MTRTGDLEVHLTDSDLQQALRDDVRRGLGGRPRTLPPKYFYDARGSDLFEQITRLPEYYPTRTERAILTAHADDIARLTAAHTLVELGSGSSEKTHLLLRALQAHGSLRSYVPVDVSASALGQAVAGIAAEYPALGVHGVVADFERHLSALPGEPPRLVAFLGGTIGNFEPAERAKFLSAVRDSMSPGDGLLLGTDLVKAPARLVAAYDDTAGITAAFNRNVLHVINRELGADFDADAFEHVAVWDADQEWVEMRLRATGAMQVTVTDLDLVIDLAAGEEIRTEISAKFRRDRVADELASAGLELAQFWTDPSGDFALSLALA